VVTRASAVEFLVELAVKLLVAFAGLSEPKALVALAELF
jgi:hypothetical protein